MRILPFPSVTFGDVVVRADEVGVADAEPLMTIAGFRMDAELAPYMSGEIRIFSMRLDRPQLRLPISPDGSLAFSSGDAGLPPGATVVLEDVEIVDGSIRVENAKTGRTHRLDDVTARVSARSLTGPFAGTAGVTVEGERMDVVFSSGPVQPEAGLPLKLTVNAPTLDTSFVFSGLAALPGAEPEFRGELVVASPLPARTAATANGPAAPEGVADSEDGAEIAPGEAAPALLPPFKLTGTIAATPSSIDLSQARVAVGDAERPYILTGAGNVDLTRLPHFDLALEGQQVNVDEIVAQGTAPEAAPSAEGPAAAVTFDQRLKAAEAVFAAVPRPSIPGTVKIALPVVVAGDTTIRDVGFTVSPTGLGWSVERFSAELPGRTRMEATGIVGLDQELSFKGDLLVASRQPSGFAGWLVGAVDPAIRTLPQAGFSAAVSLTRARQVFESLDVDIGGDMLTGRLERSGPLGARAMTASLSAGAVDLDALLALSELFTGEGDSVVDADRLALKIRAGPVRYRDAAAERIDADLSYDGARLAVARLTLDDLAGADLTVSGELAGLGGDLSGRLAVGLEVKEPTQAIALLRTLLPASPAMAALAARGSSLGPLRLSGELETVEEAPGEKPTLRARVGGTAAGTDVNATLALGNGIYAAGSSGRFGLEATLSNRMPPVLLGQLGIEAVAVETPSPLSLQLSLSAGATGPVVASAAVRAPGTELIGEGSFDLVPSGIVGADFGLSAKSDDIGPWLTATGRALGQSASATLPVDLSGTVRFADRTWSLDALSGRVGTAEVAGDLARQPDGPLSGAVYVSDLSLPWLATLVYGRSPLGDSRSWPAEEFRTALLPPVDLALDLTADRLSLGETIAVERLSAAVAVASDEIRMTDVKGAVGGGHVSGSGSMRNANGVGGVSLKADFEGLDLGALTLIASGGETKAAGDDADAGQMAGTLDMSLALDGSGQSFAAIATALAGAGRIDLEGASFAGVRPGLLRPILAAADAEGFVPNADTAARVLLDATGGARYPMPTFGTDLSVAAGIARIPPIALPGAGETLTIDGAVDLRTLDLDGTLRLDLDAGDDAVDGAEPTILYALAGPLAAPRLTPDVQPLASYLSVRAFEREEARVEAMQEQLQERLRLRREARYARWRERERLAAVEAERVRVERQREAEAQAAREAEARRAEEARQAEDARRAEEVRQAEAARRAEVERQAEEARRADRARRAEAARRIEEARRARAVVPRPETAGRANDADPSPRPADASSTQPRELPAEPDSVERAPLPPVLDLENPVPPPTEPAPEFRSLPGVEDPLKF